MRPNSSLAQRLAAYGDLRKQRIAASRPESSLAKFAFVGLQQRLIS